MMLLARNRYVSVMSFKLRKREGGANTDLGAWGSEVPPMMLLARHRYISARVRYATALPHLLLFIIFFISHVYYICYFLLSMYGHQGNAGTLSHVISVNYRKR